MSGTQIKQDRQIITVAGVNKYEILVTCTLAGTLPDRNIFLLQLTQAADPKDDTLMRVCDVADFTTYISNRDTARTNGETYWRSSELKLQFDKIDTANEAYKEVISRVNSLVTNQDIYADEFETPADGEYTNFPVADPSTSAALKETYVAAKASTEEAEAERDTKQSECTDEYQNALDCSTVRYQDAEEDRDAILVYEGQLSGLQNSYTSVQTTIQSYVSSLRSTVQGSGATAAEKQAAENDLIAVEAVLTQLSTYNNTLTSAVSLVSSHRATLQARVSTLATEVNTYTSQLNTCNQELAKLQAAVDAAKIAENEALAAVLVVCPDYDPNS